MASPRNRIRSFLALEPAVVGLLVMVVLVGMGERMAERFLPIYLVTLGGGAWSVGLLGGLDNLLSALYSYPGGYLADRVGPRAALLLFNLFAMCGYLIVILVPSWGAVLVGAVFFLSWSAISLPATMGLVAHVLHPAKRAMGVSMHSLVRRIPMALGPILGGVCIDRWGTIDGIRIAFGAALLFALLSVLVQQLYLPPSGHSGNGLKMPERNPMRMWEKMSPQLTHLLISDILIRFCEQIPNAFVVIWCMRTISSPVNGFQFGVLSGVEMLTAVLIYIPVAHFADRGHKKPFVLATFVFFTLFPLLLLFSRSFWPLAGVFVLRGLKEFGEPTRKSLILDLSPEDQKAGMFGLYYLARDTVVSVAALSGAVLWNIRPELNLLTAFFFGLLGTFWFARRGTDLMSKPESLSSQAL